MALVLFSTRKTQPERSYRADAEPPLISAWIPAALSVLAMDWAHFLHLPLSSRTEGAFSLPSQAARQLLRAERETKLRAVSQDCAGGVESCPLRRR